MSDKASDIAFDSAAPAGERYDANLELTKTYMPTSSSQLFPAEDMQKAIAYFADGLADAELMKSARVDNNIIPFPGRSNDQKTGMRSVYLDDMQIFACGDYFEKPTPLGFDSLRAMVEQTPVLNAVIGTRIAQVSLFTGISEDGGRGFEIRHQDKKHKLAPDEVDSCALLAKFFANCGWEFNPRRRKAMKRDSLTQFMSKSIRDSLTMDACPIETEFKVNRALGMDGFYAVDGATIRLCTELGYQGDDEIFATQVIQGQLATTYGYDQLIYEVRNPRTNVDLTGYGYGETELLIRVVTGYLNAMTYNISGFDKNSIPKGIMSLIGDYGTEDLAAFRRMWNATVKGIENKWVVPILAAKDPASKATFEKFDCDFDEMAFSKWMSFLTSTICAIYKIDPSEINFDSFSSGSSSLSGDDTKEKLANSKDKGFRPLMSFYESMFTDFIVSEFSDKYCFRWVGIDDEDAELADKRKVACLSLDEYRGEQGYEPYPDKTLGTAPMNATIMSAWQAAQQMKAQQDMAAQQAAAGQDQPDYGTEEDTGDDKGAPPVDGQMPADAGPDATATPAPNAGNVGGNEFGQSAAAKGDDFGKALTIFGFE